MKKVVTLLLLTLSFSIYSQDSKVGWLFINENTIALDKQQHASLGILGGSMGYMVALDSNGGRRSNAKLWGILIPTLAGTLKEWSDTNTTGFDLEDLAYTVGGGIVATYTFDFIIHRAKRRNKDRDEKIEKIDNFYNEM